MLHSLKSGSRIPASLKQRIELLFKKWEPEKLVWVLVACDVKRKKQEPYERFRIGLYSIYIMWVDD